GRGVERRTREGFEPDFARAVGEAAQAQARGQERRGHVRHRVRLSAAVVAQVYDERASAFQLAAKSARELRRNLGREDVEAHESRAALAPSNERRHARARLSW